MIRVERGMDRRGTEGSVSGSKRGGCGVEGRVLRGRIESVSGLKRGRFEFEVGLFRG